MQPRIRFALIFSLTLSGMTDCAGVPAKPDAVEVCLLDVAGQACVCGPSGHPEIPVKREPIAYCDKATAFRPSEWEKEVDYIHALESYAAEHGKAEAAATTHKPVPVLDAVSSSSPGDVQGKSGAAENGNTAGGLAGDGGSADGFADAPVPVSKGVTP